MFQLDVAKIVIYCSKNCLAEMFCKKPQLYGQNATVQQFSNNNDYMTDKMNRGESKRNTKFK